jgi:MFS family permease
MRVVAAADGKCPSCQGSIPEAKKTDPTKTAAPGEAPVTAETVTSMFANKPRVVAPEKVGSNEQAKANAIPGWAGPVVGPILGALIGTGILLREGDPGGNPSAMILFAALLGFAAGVCVFLMDKFKKK